MMFRIIIVFLLFSSCVSMEVHKKTKSRYEAANKKLKKLLRDNEKLSLENKHNKKELDSIKNRLDIIIKDSVNLTNKLKYLEYSYNDLKESYDYLSESNQDVLSTNIKRNRQLLDDIENTRKDLFKKSDSLSIMYKNLFVREKRLKELESMLTDKDSVLSYIKDKVDDVVSSINFEGIDVYEKGGRLYVSLNNSLVFNSGSWQVGQNGKQAITKLSEALSSYDIQILVEGHTDNVPYIGSKSFVKDNWDLSVMRANAIVRLILENQNINPADVIASGRGEYLPIVDNDSPDNRAKNRRTDIILIPKFNKVDKIVEEIKKNIP